MAEEDSNTPAGDAGNDTVQTGGGNDTVQAGGGDDILRDDAQDTTKAGEDTLDSTKDDTVKAGSDGDVLSDDDDTGDEGVPDQYTFDAPEGVEVNEEALESFKETAKELGLTQKQFQDLVNYDMERSQAAQQEAVDGWNERVSGWREAARKDPEFGGENYDANVKTAMQAVNRFGDKDLKALLKSPSEDNPEGLAIGNHPAMLRFLNRIGKALGDPNFVAGEDAAGGDDADARLRRLYPSMYKDSA